MEPSTTHSTVWGRLASVEDEYLKVCAERDTAILERDQARAALVPLLGQVDELRAVIVAQLPKADTRLPSRRTRLKAIPEDQVEDWAARNGAGESLHAISQGAGVSFETVRIKLIRAGHKPIMHSSEKKTEHRVPRCKECGLALDSPALTQGNVPPPVDGVCGLCQFIGDDLAEKRARAKGGNGDHGGI